MGYGKASVASVVMSCAASGFFVCAGAGEAFGALPAYGLVGQYTAPGGAFDVLPDGRLVALGGVDGRDVLVQDAVNVGSYSVVGSIDTAGPIASFGASFVRVSPDGDTVAVGDNTFGAGNSVYTFSLGDLGVSPAPTQRFLTPNFGASWGDAGTLFVTGADSATFESGVYRVDVAGGGVDLVVDDIGGASGGVAVRDGVLYTGNGFDTDASAGTSVTGEVRAVSLSDLPGGGSVGPVSFESGMTAVAEALSAQPLAFDPFGNLLVGGGDTFGGQSDAGYAGVVDGDGIADALAGGGFSPGADLELDPSGSGAALYSAAFNDATQELLVIGEGTVFRYEVPSPGSAVVLGAAGVFAGGRRRRG